ncbi:uncharacterized protein LOC135433091 isoform X2 [Drosophila montana]|uniref:uncharacterized protein LOC135433091 isoform X2 n=1 Tax=Drosophila montana TaxID=40370 RepID=UPI00313B1E53
MCYANSCCFCMSLRSGCIAISLFSIFSAGLNIDFIISILTDYKVARVKYLFPAGARISNDNCRDFLVHLHNSV